MIAEYRTDSPEATAAIDEAKQSGDPLSIWIHGSITYLYTGEDVPAPPSEDQGA